MIKHWLKRGALIAACALAFANPVSAGYPEFGGVQSRDADPSPGPGSFINNYLFQDEQINVTPGDGVVKVLRTNQKNLVHNYVTQTFAINRAMAREMRNVMRVAMATEGGSAEVIRDPETGESWLQVVAPDFMMPYIADAVASLDVPWLKEYWDGAADIYVKLQHREAELVDVLASQYAGTEGFSRLDLTNNALSRFDEVYRNEQYMEAVKIIDQPCNMVELEITAYEVAQNDDLKLGLDYLAWENGPGRNLFTFANAGYSDFQRARGLTSVYDPFIDARLGVLADPSLGKEEVADLAARESYRAVNYLLTSNYVDFLQNKGEARVITSQKLLLCSANTGTVSAEDQVVAIVNNANDLDRVITDDSIVSIVRLNNGATPLGPDTDDLPVFAAAAGSGKATYFLDTNFNGLMDKGEPLLRDAAAGKIRKDTPTGGEAELDGPVAGAVNTNIYEPLFGEDESPRYVDYEIVDSVGISVAATPYVGLESMELELDISMGDLNGIAPSGLPIINTREVVTTVRLLDGQPYVIAGLKRKHDISNTAKAPLLGSIPILGYLFGGEVDVNRENNVVIVVRPKFFLSNQVNIHKPPRIDTIKAIMNGEVPLGAPSIDPFYDQWLLDS